MKIYGYCFKDDDFNSNDCDYVYIDNKSRKKLRDLYKEINAQDQLIIYSLYNVGETISKCERRLKKFIDKGVNVYITDYGMLDINKPQGLANFEIIQYFAKFEENVKKKERLEQLLHNKI